MKRYIKQLFANALVSDRVDTCRCGNINANDLEEEIGMIIDTVQPQVAALLMNGHLIGVYVNEEAAHKAKERYIKAIVKSYQENPLSYSGIPFPSHIAKAEDCDRWLHTYYEGIFCIQRCEVRE